ncbi:MAG: serine hydrolase domain-containing protein [Gammaproteobacteria bacterium]
MKALSTLIRPPLIAAALMALSATTLPASPFSITGPEVPQLEAFDRYMRSVMTKWRVPGGALAVVRKGRLVLARGYGVADRNTRIPVEPRSLFRIASVSKPITAVATLKLVEQGRLGLDDPILPFLIGVPGIDAGRSDKRMSKITIRHLLQHSGGWASDISADPMFNHEAVNFGGGAPSCENVVRHTLRRPLDFEPGTRKAYSNFGYCLLGVIIEQLTGQTYGRHIREQVLAPMGIRRMDLARRDTPYPGEVRYHGLPGDDPYGFAIEAIGPGGGWVASVVELARFMSHVDAVAEPADALKLQTLKAMIAPPAFVRPKRGESWYGLGFAVRDVPGKGYNWWHTGSLGGTHALAVRTWDGTVWVALMNHRPRDWSKLGEDMDKALWKARSEVSEWPSHDLFDHYLEEG